MHITKHLGIIGGNGWLGNAMALAAVERGLVSAGQVTLSSRSGSRGADPIAGATWTRDNAALASRADIIVLSVRPQQFPEVEIDASGKLVVSVMAGVSAATIAARTGASRIVRAMPNAAMEIRKSFTPWYATPTVSAEEKATLQVLFDACGEGAEVAEEWHVDYCAGLTGSGAAFPALLAQAMIAHAVAQGLPPDFAARAAKSVVAEASQLLGGPSGDPAQMIASMIGYQGTTAAALETMQAQGFMEAVAAGLDAALAKGRKMAAG
ncbi:pyrroline-5-carboxylate reductase family protein [Dongia sp.]|uniref:pyrroline-5-carboxylate reductase family protein n=1 Tax=Dongia sp. TaxID=1977262 RepID=UPI0035ADCA10